MIPFNPFMPPMPHNIMPVRVIVVNAHPGHGMPPRKPAPMRGCEPHNHPPRDMRPPVREMDLLAFTLIAGKRMRQNRDSITSAITDILKANGARDIQVANSIDGEGGDLYFVGHARIPEEADLTRFLMWTKKFAKDGEVTRRRTGTGCDKPLEKERWRVDVVGGALRWVGGTNEHKAEAKKHTPPMDALPWVKVSERLPESGDEVMGYYSEPGMDGDVLHLYGQFTYYKAGDILEDDFIPEGNSPEERLMDALMSNKGQRKAPEDGFYIYDTGRDGLGRWRKHNDCITHWFKLTNPAE